MLPIISCLLANIKSSNRGIPKKKNSRSSSSKGLPKAATQNAAHIALHTSRGVQCREKFFLFPFTSEKRGASLSVIFII